MIHYQLRCDQAHEFDGWFKDSATFDRQAKAGLVECPTCGDVKVTRALMAPRVSTRESLPVPVQAPQPPAEIAPQPMAASGRIPAEMIALLQRMRSVVEKHCDYVGPEFANEARKIHNGDAEQRGIYGETTKDEAEALAEEGIEVSSIPWVPRAEG